jgi:hypothetical protein
MKSTDRNGATMATRIDDLDKPYEINGYAMTHPRHGTARAFERAGYAVTGTCLGSNCAPRPR